MSELPRRIGPFEVVRRLGVGGMAEAFLAVREGPGAFEQRVCIKRVLPTYREDRELGRLFLREARNAALLSHRNIVSVVELGEDEGQPYLVLELVDGMDLRQLGSALPAPRRFSAAVTALIGMELAEALEHAHTRGGHVGPIIHRDVSPANVLLSVNGEVKLSDFGVSKALREATSSSPFVRGNVWYMAPERLEGEARCDPRSDLYSLGVVLYQCIAGRRPYEAPSSFALMRALVSGKRVPLAEAAPEAPKELAQVIERLLAYDPSERYPSASAVVDALAPWTEVASARRALSSLVREHRRNDGTPSTATLEIDQSRSAEAAGHTTKPARVTRTPQPKREITEVRVRSADALSRFSNYQIGPGMWRVVPVAAMQLACAAVEPSN